MFSLFDGTQPLAFVLPAEKPCGLAGAGYFGEAPLTVRVGVIPLAPPPLASRPRFAPHRPHFLPLTPSPLPYCEQSR